jgi:hypothetical protein
MPDRVAAAIAAIVRAEPDEADIEEAWKLVRNAPSPQRVVDELARHRAVEVRDWAIDAAVQVLGTSATPILMRLAKDRDPDVKSQALLELARIDKHGARQLLPQVRRQLRSTDFWTSIKAMWAIAIIGATDALDDVRAAGLLWPVDYAPHRIADIVGTLLEGRTADLVRQLRDHDHVATPWLANALSIDRSREALEALQECAEHGADEFCRKACAHALQRAEGRSTHG